MKKRQRNIYPFNQNKYKRPLKIMLFLLTLTPPNRTPFTQKSPFITKGKMKEKLLKTPPFTQFVGLTKLKLNTWKKLCQIARENQLHVIWSMFSATLHRSPTTTSCRDLFQGVNPYMQNLPYEELHLPNCGENRTTHQGRIGRELEKELQEKHLEWLGVQRQEHLYST